TVGYFDSYDKASPRPRVDDKTPFPSAAVTLLASLRADGEAPNLGVIAGDNRQHPATRLACLLAVLSARESITSRPLLAVLKEEKSRKRRVFATVALAYCRDRKASNANLVELLDDADEQVQTAAVLALLTRPAKEALPRLARMLDDRRPLAAVRYVVE